jgi:hypothetical protein
MLISSIVLCNKAIKAFREDQSHEDLPLPSRLTKKWGLNPFPKKSL